MTDRRTLWSNGVVAHSSLLGDEDAMRFSDGVDHQVIASPGAALRKTPGGDRDRELLWGRRFCVLDISDGVAFGFAQADGYAGYVDINDLRPATETAMHWVSVRQTMALTEPKLKTTKTDGVPLSFGSEVVVRHVADRWAAIDGPNHNLFVPAHHIAPIVDFATDPVAVAEKFLGSPYVWGGNTSLGIDCSGLVQVSCRACGVPCPGDSDQQAEGLGETLADGVDLVRGDLVFWKGHVAWVVDPDTLLHANAYAMAVAYEPLEDTIRRIAAQGEGPVIRRARLTLT